MCHVAVMSQPQSTCLSMHAAVPLSKGCTTLCGISVLLLLPGHICLELSVFAVKENSTKL